MPVKSDLTRACQHDYYAERAAVYIEELRAKPAEEIGTLVSEERNKEAEETAARLRREEDARFFNRPGAQADYTHWSRAAYWTLEEAVALSFGKNPRVVNWKTIEFHLGVSPFVASYRDIRHLANRAKLLGQLCDPVASDFHHP